MILTESDLVPCTLCEKHKMKLSVQDGIDICLMQIKTKKGDIMIKKIVICVVLSTQLLFSTGIPTVDIAAILNAVRQGIETASHYRELAVRWKHTITQYKNELKAYENELASKTGTRDSVKFLKDLKRAKDYADTFGEDFLSLDITQDSKSKLAKLKKALYEKYQIFDRCKEIPLLEWQNNCKKSMSENVDKIAVVQTMGERFNKNSKEIDELSQKLANSKDTKESQDLQNAINLKMIEIQRKDQLVQMEFRKNEADERALAEQQAQADLLRLGKAPRYEIPSDWK